MPLLLGGLVTATSNRSMAQRLANDSITLELLHEAVDNTNPDGYEGIPFSDGMRWIRTNVQQFLELLEQSKVSVEEFFRPHLDNFYLGSLLNDTWLLLTFGDERRLPFMTEVFLSVGSLDRYWLESAKAVGITDDQLAKIILAKLEVDKPDLTRSIVNFTKHNFVEDGAGRVNQNFAGRRYFDNWEPTYWSVLTDEQLTTAFSMIIEKAAVLLFGYPTVNDRLGVAEKLAVRLGDEAVNRLLEQAADQLESFTGVDYKIMGRLPVDVQLRTARRLLAQGVQLPSIWIVNMALKMGTNGGEKLLEEFEDAFNADLRAFQTWQAMITSKEAVNFDAPVVAMVEERMFRSLKKSGWTIGTLTVNMHKGQRQFCVQNGRTRFVKDRYQTTYQMLGSHQNTFPEVGDVVAFRPDSGRMLVPGRVWTVTFTLVGRPK